MTARTLRVGTIDRLESIARADGPAVLRRIAGFDVVRLLDADGQYRRAFDLATFLRSGMNAKIKRNFQVFSACDFIAAITQHKGCGALASAAIEIIEHRALQSRRIPSRSWRERIKKVWEVDPPLCPQCHHEMRIVSLINDAQIIERILRHVGPGGVDQWVDEVCNRRRAVA